MDTPPRRRRRWWRIPVVFACPCCLTGLQNASNGDADHVYRSCVEKCETSGCVGDNCFQHCKFSSNGKPIDGPWYLQEPLYLKWKQWDCLSDCRYHCVLTRERRKDNNSVTSPLNIMENVHFFGSMACRDVEWIEKLDYSSMVALIGFSLILAVLRTLNVRDEATTVMCAAPVIVFVVTHISYLNFNNLDYGWNMKICVTMAIIQLLIWAGWAIITCHPSRWKLRSVVIGRVLSMLLKVYDFPPYLGYVDAHALWHATTFPLTYLWWSFIRDDAEFRTSLLVKKVK